jgi:hypothetical protein
MHQITLQLRSRYAFTPLLSSGLFIPHLQSMPKEKEIDTDPTWSELLRRIGHITPYLWPKKNRTLQLFAVCPLTIYHELNVQL